MDKKKIGLIAILLFLLIGLGSFVFANPDNEENFEGREPSGREEIDSKGDGESTKDDGDVSDSETLVTGESDGQNNGQATDNQRAARNVRNTTITGGTNGVTGGNGNNGGNTTTGNGGNGGSTIDYYADALKAVETAESSLSQADVDKATELVKKVTNQEQKDALTDRLNDVQDIIDVTSLVSRLETMVADSTDRNGILDSIDFRDKEKVEELVNDLKNGDAKDNLVGRLETVNKILNDNDGPVIKGIDNNSFTRKDVELTIKDDNDVTIKVTKDGTEVDYTGKFTEEGTYVITAVDAAFNETTLTFTIDKTMPVIKGVEDGGLYNHAVTVTIDEVKIQDAKYLYEGKWYSFESGATFDKDGTYFIRVTDAAYNKKAELTFTIDTKVETPKWVYVLNVSDENNRQTIRNGQTLRVEVNSKEELTELPVLTIGNGQSATARKCSQEDYGYVCVIDLKIDNTVAKLEDGKEIPFTITNIKDKAGNTLTLDNDDVTSTKKYGQVTYDESAPVVKSLGITDIDEYKDETGKLYIKNGGTVRVLVYFEEKLGTEPTVKLGGKEYKATYREASSRPKDNSYAYYADIKITDEMNLADGIIPFEVYGYTDKVGNVGTLLTQADVNSKTYPSVTLDNTKPVLKAANILVDGDANEQKYFYAKIGDTIYSYVRFNEQLKEMPTFTLINDGKKYEVADVTERAYDNGEYGYSIRYTIDENTKMTDGEITMLVTNIQDKAGNKYADINKPSNGHVVYFDKTAPKKVSLKINSSYKTNKEYGKVGDSFGVYLVVDEELAQNPTFTVNGKEYKVNQTETVNSGYKYAAVYPITDDMKEGLVEFTISNIVDKAGNKLNDLTNTDTNETLVIDKTAPKVLSLTQKYEDKEGGRIKVTITTSEEIYGDFVNEYGWRKVKENTYENYFYRSKDVKIDATDIAGNAIDYSFTVDLDAPQILSLTQKYENKEGGRIKVTITTSEEIYGEFINQYGWRKVDVNTYENYYYRSKDVTINATDKVGNPLEYKFTVDADAPQILNITQKYEDKEGGRIKVTITTSEEIYGEFINQYGWRKVDVNTYENYFYRSKDVTINATDKVGNPLSYKFTVDADAPKVSKLLVHSSYETNNAYGKVGDYFGIYLNVNEELSQDPTFVVNGVEYKVNQPEGRKISDNLYQYAVVYPITDDMKEGELEFTISNIADKIGNKTNDLTAEDGDQKLIIDKTAPELTLKDKRGKKLDFGWYTHDLYVDIEDANGYTALLNGEEYKSGSKISDRKSYTLVVTDKAGNSVTKEFGIDKDSPKISGVKDGGYYNTAVTPIVKESNLVSLTLNGEAYESGTPISAEGKYVLVATDIVGHKTTVEFTIDITPVALVDIRVNSNNKNENYAKVGDKVGIYLNVNEELRENPTFVINGVTYKVNQTAAAEKNNGNYMYAVLFDVTEDMPEGKVQFNISNIYDKAGNQLNDLSNTNTKEEVIIDKTAPVYKSLGIYGGEKYNDIMYVANGDKVYINVQFSEKLAVSPYVKVNGKEVFQYGEPVENKSASGEKYYIYSKVYNVNDKEGRLSFEIYGYADAAGNEGKKLTADNTTIGGQNGNIVVDNTAPSIGDLESNKEYTGSIHYEMSDNSGSFKLYYDLGHNFQSCDELISKGTLLGTLTDTYEGDYYIAGSHKGISVCLVDAAGNKTFRNNISINN